MKRFFIVRQLDGSEQQFTENDLPLTVGSGADNHIVLPASEPVGAYIEISQGHLFVQPAAQHIEPLFHNDRLLNESVWLKSNDQMRCRSYVIRYERSGDRSIFSVVQADQEPVSPVLSPPLQAPHDNSRNGEGAEEIPVDITGSNLTSRRKKIALGAVGLGLLLLGCAVLFVLLARPLELRITPDPDSVSISGFPPAIKINSRYLMLPGEYSVAVSKKGYATFEQPLYIDKTSQNLLNVDLKKLPGILNLLVSPADGVKIYSESKLIATTPPDRISIPPGNHQLTLAKDRYQPFEIDVLIEGQDVVQTLEATLQPDWADITITSEPINAQVYVDGTEVGQTPVTLQLLSGDHQIVLKEALYFDSTQLLTVKAGNDETIDYRLNPLPGQLLLSSTPDGAVVSVNNAYKGTTPVELTLPSGKVQELKLSHPGHKSLAHQVMLAPAEDKEIMLVMEQERGTLFLTITPTNATVSINGKSYEDIQGKLTLPATPQTIEVSLSGYKSVSRTITPDPGFSQQVAIDLVPNSQPGVSSSTGVPPGAPSRQVPTKEQAVTSSGQRLIYIKPSPFTMGAPRREPGRRANERERKIVMEKPFLIGEKLVSNQEYRKFDSSHDSGSFGGNSLNGDKQPVVNIVWNQAAAYLNWLSRQDDLQPFYIKRGDQYVAASPPTNGYRLPTEAEWAYSARLAGKQDRSRYPWSGGFPPRTVVANFADESARTILPRVLPEYNDSFPVTSPVGSFPPNQAGLYDMGGNASEWCHDFYSAYTGRLADSRDPLGPPNGVHKVIRGSNWKDASITEMRLSYRAYHKEARNNVGFRIARYP